MERLRRRIRLICADYPAGQSRMTVVRRELPLSSGASRLDRGIGRRIGPTRALQSCPHRAVADAAQEPGVQTLRSSVTPFVLGRLGDTGPPHHRGPHEAHKFTGDGRHRDGWALAVPDEMAIPTVQTLLRAPGVCDDVAGLALAAPGQHASDPRRVTVVPRCFDEDATRVRVAGLRQRPSTLHVAGGVLAGNQPKIGHELARTAETLEVDDLGHEDHSRERVDAAKAAEPADRLPIERGGGQGLDLLVERRLARQRLLEGKERGLEGPSQRRQIELLLADPAPVSVTPVLTRVIGPAVAG